MSKVLDMLRRGKKQAALVAIIAAAVVIPASLYAWGPSRATFTEQSPAPYITFNSITNNSNYGDERDFVMIKESTAPDSTWSSTATAQPGKEYTVRMYVHNNAADNLNLVAENVRASASIKQGVSKDIGISGFISADNANPGQVWDDANLTSDKDFNVNYVAGSAYYRNNIFTNGTALPDSVMTSGGALLGYDKLDGKIPGCYKYSGYVYFKVKPQFAETTNFTVSKKVSKQGTNNWVESYAAQPGETVDYLIQYKNTGTTQQDNVVVKDKLPAGMQYVPGSTKFGTKANPNGQQASDNITTTGINIGSYAPNAGTWVMFSAKAPAKEALECGTNTLKNVARVETDGGYKEDDADVTVPKECQEQPEYKCTALAVSKLSDTKFKFETGYTVKGGTFKSVSYTIRNEAGSVVATVNGTPNAVEYTQTTPGKYTVQATVTFTVNGQDVTATGEACKKAFEVPTPPKDIQVCELATKKIITIKESDFDATKHSKNLDDCKETPVKIQVCELSTKKVITINEADFDATKHSKDLNDCKAPGEIIVCDLTTKEVITIKEDQFDASKHSKDLNDCKAPEEHCPIPGKENLPKDSADCKETCPVPGKEHMPKDSPDCKETPVTPTELPQTGAGDGILTIAGLATFALIAGYAVTGRRTLG